MKSKIFILIIGIVIGIVIGFAIIALSNACINYNEKPSLHEYVYYCSQLVGVLATTLAVIVAIWGQEIKKALFRPKCSLWLENDGFVEQLGETEGTASPKAKYYECLLCIKNSGNKEIDECAIFINQISYKSKQDQKRSKMILKNAHNILYWGQRSDKWINLIAEDQRDIPLFRIYPNSAIQTPDGCNTSPMRINIMGYNMLEDRYSKDGIWEIAYTLQTKERILQRFILTVKWDGHWFDREQEMENDLDVDFKTL